MIIVQVKEGEVIDRALKRYKRKFDRMGTVRELRRRSQFIKPSVSRRAEFIKATYIQKIRSTDDN
jgi:small subunit ribosomal protein S21